MSDSSDFLPNLYETGPIDSVSGSACT